MNKKLLYSLIIIIVFSYTLYVLINHKRIANVVSFECPKEDSIILATFYTNGSVDLKLYGKDGELSSLDNLKERDGNFYNDTGSIVFWSEGDEPMSTFLEKDGVTILECKFQTFVGDH